jgi:hypothetical protein
MIILDKPLDELWMDPEIYCHFHSSDDHTCTRVYPGWPATIARILRSCTFYFPTDDFITRTLYPEYSLTPPHGPGERNTVNPLAFFL